MLGSHQSDALQNIAGQIGVRSFSNRKGISVLGANGAGAFEISEVAVEGSNAAYSEGTSGTAFLTMNASRVARTSSETRGSNVALAPRIIAF